MFFIRQGEVEVHIRGKGVVAVKHAGDFFGEVALFLPESFRIRTATCRARTLCELMILDKSDADLVKSNFPELAAAMVRGAAMNGDIYGGAVVMHSSLGVHFKSCTNDTHLRITPVPILVSV